MPSLLEVTSDDLPLSLLEVTMESTPHEPVLVDTIADLLAVGNEPGLIVDATVGMGGHALALLARSGPDVALVGFDRDPDALTIAERRLAAFRDRVHLLHAGYDELDQRMPPLVARHGPVRAVLYDLGVSSLQLDRAERGFSFRHDAPLDMRMDQTSATTAADVVNGVPVDQLRDLLRTYGEERHATRIARAIVAARPLTSTSALVDVVVAALPRGGRDQRVHPATRTFQALRITVNDELERFRASLPQALELARHATPDPAPTQASAGRGGRGGRGGRVAVLSYHSLEDRIAKRAFVDVVTGCVCPPGLPVCGCGRSPQGRLLIRGIARPDAAEIQRNPRARSAKLRAVELHAATGTEQ